MATTTTINDDSVLVELLSPDGYYRYLGVSKPSPSKSMTTDSSATSSSASSTKSNSKLRAESDQGNAIDTDEKEFIDQVKKNYRKLSLKHHPDKLGGNVDTFRLLNRAQRVLLDSKLRTQYDLLGIDLDDDEVESDTGNNSSSGGNDTADENTNRDHYNTSSSSQGILQEIASNILAGVLQLGVRTSMLLLYCLSSLIVNFHWLCTHSNMMYLSFYFWYRYIVLMGIVSVIIVRYWFTVYPAYLFLLYTIYRIISMKSNVPGGSIYDTIPPTCIAIGIFLMHRASTNTSATSGGRIWTTQYWIGEALVIGMFIYNSISGTFIFSLKPIIVWSGIGILSFLIALWFRGSIWNYCLVIGLIAIVALLVAMAFPIMELIVDAILNEKLRKVGDKVRHHNQMIHAYYEKKYELKR
jgi:hypothetical protein